MEGLFAGLLNTSIVCESQWFARFANSQLMPLNQACWMPIDLAIHPEWREKCKKAIQGLLSRHLDDALSPATLSEKLGTIPISTWEDKLPILNACIRESQQIYHTVFTIRRNLRGEMRIGGQVVR